MNYFKKLFLSATTILITAGAVDPAHAFYLSKSRNQLKTSNAQQQIPQSNANPKMSEDLNTQLEVPLLLIKKILGSHDQVEVKKLSEELIAHLIKLNGNKIDLAKGVVSAVKSLDHNQNDLQALREEIFALREEINHLRTLIASHQQKPQEDYENFNVHGINQPAPLSFDVLPTHHLTSISTSRDSGEEISQQPLLSGFDTPRPSDDQISSSTPILSSDNSLTTESFEQTVLRFKPDTLETMTASEIDVWRTFTMLTFTNQNKDKPWSTWNGAYSTEELDEKFKENAFIKKAFKDISAHLLLSESLIFFPENVEYFILPSPDHDFDVKKDEDLTKAYYFRNLYRSLTDINWNGRTTDSNTVGFNIDLTSGIKGSRFTYGPSNSTSSHYETPLYEAEDYFKNTPWHALFIQKVITATVASLPNLIQKTQEIIEKHNPETLRLTNLIDENQDQDIEYAQKPVTTHQEKPEFLNTTELQAKLFELTAQRNAEIENLNTQRSGVLKATTLREIDEALGII